MNDLRPSLKLSWRVGLGYTLYDAGFERLLNWIRIAPELLDEVALFETITHHLYIPLEEYAERCEMLQERMGQLRLAGIPSVGINVLTTIGHTNEAWDYNPPLPFQAMVGHDGAVSRGCGCPNTPELRAYIGEKYRMTAATGPDFIWVDDDIRIQHHGVQYPCFCPTCLGLFAQRTGQDWTRESLVAALDSPAGGELRAAWVEQNCATIESLLADVRTAIHSVNPQITIGLMTAGAVWSTYSGPDHARWYRALGATKSRPGGGFYSDDPRRGLIDKTLVVGQQRAMLPPGVPDCQYELENFPGQMLNKAHRTVINECTAALGMGLNGIAHNWLPGWGTSEDGTPAQLREAARWRPVWEQLVSWGANLPTVGLREAVSVQLAARRQVKPGETWFSGPYAHTAELLAYIGLPVAVDGDRCGHVLRGRMAEAFSDDELRRMLSGGLLLDAGALEVLEQRGLGELCGVRIGKRFDNGLLEQFTDDALNGAFVGEKRDARIEFWGNALGLADRLDPRHERVRVLAELADYSGRTHGACLTAYENELGGRVAVMGYAPWMFVFSAAKREQLLNLADWLTRGAVPLRITRPAAVTPFVRLAPDGARGTVVLLNWGLDPLARLPVELRIPPTRVRLISPDGEQELPGTATAEGMTVNIPEMSGWSVAVLLIG